MRGRISKGGAIALAIATVFFMYQETTAQPKPASAARRTTAATPDITYTISMSKPWTHLLEVEMRVRSRRMPERTELKMPVWTPGSYLVREFARHVQDFSVADAGGRPLAWEKVNKNR